MTQPAALQLPPEVWNHVFGYLSAADKFNVRASCKYFKKLVDHRSLWKDCPVFLRFRRGSYNGQFWATLRRRRVSSVVVRGGRVKHWKHLARCLPALTTVVMDRSSPSSLDDIKDFLNLKRLAIRNSHTYFLNNTSTVCHPQKLTHLSLCHVTFCSSGQDDFISFLSQFTNLTSLTCHQTGINSESIIVVQDILDCLPKLEHLSLSMAYTLRTRHTISQPNPDSAPVLSSLELIDCMYHSLPEDTMKLMPCLKTLAIFYQYTHQEMPKRWPSCDVCHLNTWLRDLPQLATLVVVKGPPVNMFVASIPATLTSLTLCCGGLSTEHMSALAVKAPHLHHLHMDPWPARLGTDTAQIPCLFPQLRSLKLRHEGVPERDFLSLHQLQDLEYLEILDDRPHLSELIGKLRDLTKYRPQVTTSRRKRDVLSCPCVSQVY